MMNRNPDIIVAGGGMVGAAMALSLAKRDIEVALVETSQPPSRWPAEGWENRVSAISRASQLFLDQLGVWQQMPIERLTAYRQMHVWNAAQHPGIHFDAADIGEPDLGHIIENSVIQKALWDEMAAYPSLHPIYPVEIEEITFIEGLHHVHLSNNDPLQAPLIIGADGANSFVREQAGLSVTGAAYDQTALVATVTPALGHQETAWQRFLLTGPLALLPIGDHDCSIVWSTSPDEADRLKELPEEDFNAEITLATEGRLGAIQLTDTAADGRTCFPLRHQHADQYITDGLVLIGDAAHVIHPLAGQGVNLGFADVIELTRVLGHARTLRRPLGDRRTLRPYERARRGENLLVESVMTGFKELFTNNNPLLNQMRNLGLGATDRLKPLKHLITTAALGAHR